MYFRVSNVKSCGIKGYRIPSTCMDKLNYIVEVEHFVDEGFFDA